MGPTFAQAVEPVVGGLAAALGVYATQEIWTLLRRRGLCPERWSRSRAFLLPRGPKSRPDRIGARSGTTGSDER